jgi:hypothetical protein
VYLEFNPFRDVPAESTDERGVPFAYEPLANSVQSKSVRVRVEPLHVVDAIELDRVGKQNTCHCWSGQSWSCGVSEAETVSHRRKIPYPKHHPDTPSRVQAVSISTTV